MSSTELFIFGFLYLALKEVEEGQLAPYGMG